MAIGAPPTAELAAKKRSAIPQPLQPLEQSIKDVESGAAFRFVSLLPLHASARWGKANNRYQFFLLFPFE